jgi:acyl carrier protein
VQNDQIFDAVVAIVSRELSVPVEKVTPTAYFVDDLGTDSLHLITIAMALEERFSIRLPDDDLKKVVTVQDLVDVIKRIKPAGRNEPG